MNLQPFKSGLLIGALILASCSHKQVHKNEETLVTSNEAPASAPAPTEAASVPMTSSMEESPRIELKPSSKVGKSVKAIEITDAQRAKAEASTEKASVPSTVDVVPTALGATSGHVTDPNVPDAKTEPSSLNDKASHPVEVAGVEPTQAMRWLQNGNKRFVKGWLRKDGQDMKDIKRLAKSQRPHTIVLSCSDSRVPPELVFDQKLGEIFTIRTAGEVPDENVIASIEYAVVHLGSRLVLVMGHSSCGAVKAAVSTLEGADAGSPALNHLVSVLHPYVREALGKGPASKNFEVEGWAAAHGVAGELVKRSEIIRTAVEKGQLLVKTSLYHLDSGVVDFE